MTEATTTRAGEPTGTPAARRPSEAARQALHAARRARALAAATTGETAPAAPPAPTATAGPAPEPAPAPGPPKTPKTPKTPAVPKTTDGPTAPSAPTAGAAPARPGDVARRALRSALARRSAAPTGPADRAGGATPTGFEGVPEPAGLKGADETEAAGPTGTTAPGPSPLPTAASRLQEPRFQEPGLVQEPPAPDPSPDPRADRVPPEADAVPEPPEPPALTRTPAPSTSAAPRPTTPAAPVPPTLRATTPATPVPPALAPVSVPLAPGPASAAPAPDTLAAPAVSPSPTPMAATAAASAAPVAEGWGAAWLRALEDGGLDPGRLRAGLAYEATGAVGTVGVTPGRALAYVRGDRPRPYRAQLRLRVLTDEQWDAFLDTAAAHPGQLAALLDGDVPIALAGGNGPGPLPGPGDLVPSCGCADPVAPCPHTAALCHATARLLDADPFVLLRLRGRAEDALRTELARRGAARATDGTEPAPPFPGVRARTALAPCTLPALPPPLPVPAHPGPPPARPSRPDGPDPFALDQLATDAAARAHALLTTGRDPFAGLTPWQDAVRIAASRPGSGLTAATRALYASLAGATGRTTGELRRAAAAWRQGGAAALAVLEEPWDPPAGRFDRARPALLAAGLPAFRPVRNHLTHPRGHLQLRLGRDGLWYAYESERGQDDWWPRGTPAADPVTALAPA
ncbi:SWIM zinc finger family protein [Streptomyces sp. JNUCC 64]